MVGCSDFRRIFVGFASQAHTFRGDVELNGALSALYARFVPHSLMLFDSLFVSPRISYRVTLEAVVRVRKHGEWVGPCQVATQICVVWMTGISTQRNWMG